MLAAAVRRAGGSAELLRFVPDDVDQFHAALEPHVADTDLIITSVDGDQTLVARIDATAGPRWMPAVRSAGG